MPFRRADMNKLEIIAENLTDARSLLNEGIELQRAHLKELSKIMFDGREHPSENYRTLVSLLQAKRKAADEANEKDGFGAYHAELDLHSRLTLAREWAKLADPMPLDHLTASADGAFSISHFGNLYADQALAIFAGALGNTTALRSEDYVSACEEVSDGNADLCILPIESARDGVMERFEQMIDRYSLFVLMTCAVRLPTYSDDGEDDWIRYALLSASPCRLDGSEPADRIQIRLAPEGEALWEILLAADLLGARLLECRLSGRSGEREAAYRLTFSANEKIRARLIAYLELGYAGYVLLGAYSEIYDRPNED